MRLVTKDMACPVCASGNISVFFEISDVPVHCNLLWGSREAALKAPRGNIKLCFCDECGHIFNACFDPALMKYTQEYENSLHFSAYFQDYARSLALKLIERHNLYGKDLIEIGCGKGDFLLMLCELGGNRGVGFDSSYVHPKEDGAENRVTFVQDFYSEQYSGYKGDMICSRHVLEHIEKPRDFMLNVRSAIGNRENTVIFFEVPNALHMLRELAVWDIIYEHYSYFSAASMYSLFSETGFKTTVIDESFEGQFLCVEAIPRSRQETGAEPEDRFAYDIKKDVAAFARRYAAKLHTWKSELDGIAIRGQKAVIWGAGSKGVSFLNVFRIERQFEYAVDINPRKQGKFLPGSGQMVIAPEFLKEYCPDLIIVMNPNYIGEIRQAVKDMGLKSRILIA